MQKDSHFKVLDIYSQKDKTQITLLHLPEKHWDFFINMKINIDDQLIDHVRKRFSECLATDPIPELATDVWLKRCSFPLGMDDNGNLFSL
jgi:hypothetical protein